MTEAPMTEGTGSPRERPPARSLAGNAVGQDVVLLAIVWCAMIALVQPYGDFPINDDWTYAASVQSVLAGRFEILGCSSANIGALAYAGALFARVFGFSFDVLRSCNLVFGLFGVIAVYLLFRFFWSSRRLALVAALTTALNPVYFALACSFMTDIPFVAMTAWSILALTFGIARSDNRLVVLGLVIALAAMSVRQVGAVIFAGYAVAHCGRRGFGARSVIVALLPLAAALTLDALFSWWLLDTGRKAYATGIADRDASLLLTLGGLKWSALAVLSSIVSCGLFLLPIALLCLPALRSSRSSGVWVVAISVLCFGMFASQGLWAPIGKNVLHWYGIGPLSNGDTLIQNMNLPVAGAVTKGSRALLTLLSAVATACLLVAGVLGGARLGLRVWRRRRSSVSAEDAQALLVAGVSASYAALLLLLAGRGFGIFDRYLLPLTLFAGLVLPNLRLRPPLARGPLIGRGHMILASAMLVFAGAFTAVTTHDFFSWSRTRWAALQGLVATGVSPHRIDGGYEFNGSYLYDPFYRVVEGKNWWWVDDDEYVAASGPMPGYSITEVFPVHRWWEGGGRDVFILHR